MKKKTMWITAAAIGAVLVFGGAGVAIASSDVFDDDGDRSTATTPATDDSGSASRFDTGDDSDDRSTSTPVTDEQRADAEAAALDAVGGGTVREFDTGDADDRYAYKVEIVTDDGRDVEVEFAADLSVLRIDDDSSSGSSSGSDDSGRDDSGRASGSDDSRHGSDDD